MNNQRLEQVRQWLGQEGLDALLVTRPENRRYLSGFTGSNGVLLVSRERAILATDFRYIEQAEKEAPAFSVARVRGPMAEGLAAILLEGRTARVGFEAAHLSFSDYSALAAALGKGTQKVELVPTERVVESLRATKEKGETELIQKAANLADAAISHISTRIRPGMKEREAAWELEKFLKENGSGSLPFDVIVAAGPASAMPHARPTERAILKGEPVVIDLGAQVTGYVSDMTRTFCLGGPEEKFQRIYNVALEAQLAAIRSLEVGMPCREADRVARDIIARAGFGEAFGHGLGHGVGLSIHEQPVVGPLSTEVVGEGMVFTVEPSIYIQGWGGVRIEDMVVMEGGKARVMTSAPKDNPFLL